MPTYNFRHIHTGEIIEKIMRISEKADFLEANPEYESVILSAPSMADPVSLGVRRPDNGFKEVLQRIDKLTPGSKLKSTTNIL
jgi:hypothetical protein